MRCSKLYYGEIQYDIDINIINNETIDRYIIATFVIVT
jgi:hypothetical protein